MQVASNGKEMFDQLHDQGFAVIEGIHPADSDELAAAYSDVMANVPLPDPQLILDMYDPETDEVLYDAAADPSTDLHLYATRLWAPGKPKGHTDRTFENGVLQTANDDEALSHIAGKRVHASDKKKYFHMFRGMLRDLQAEYEAAGKNWAIPPELEEFLLLGDAMHRRVGAIVMQAIEELGQIAGDPGLVTRLGKQADIFAISPLRVLGYDPSRPDELTTESTEEVEIGAIHADKGFFTAAMSESSWGLRVEHRDDPQNMQLITRQPGTIALFPGLQAIHYIPKSAPERYQRVIRPSRHDIIGVNAENFTNFIGRYAQIWFLDAADSHFSNDKAHSH